MVMESPAALITADELTLAGSQCDGSASAYLGWFYLGTDDSYPSTAGSYYTMTPMSSNLWWNEFHPYIFGLRSSNPKGSLSSYGGAVRPTLSLLNDALALSGGNGSSSKPYIISIE